MPSYIAPLIFAVAVLLSGCVPVHYHEDHYHGPPRYPGSRGRIVHPVPPPVQYGSPAYYGKDHSHKKHHRHHKKHDHHDRD